MTSRLGNRESGRMTQVSPSLWWYRDTCNVFLWTAGDVGLLVDFGSGAILDELEATGVREIVAIAHTHHHRDQCGGGDRAVALGIPIWVPDRERGLFESTEAFWRTRRTYDSYDASSAGFTRTSSVPVARGLIDHQRVAWAGGSFEVLPTPGHTKGSISLLAGIDGASVAFTGDVIAAPGRVPTLYDLQWQYGMPDAVGAALHSVTALADRGPSRLMPSHGAPMEDGGTALTGLAANLKVLARLLAEIRRNRLWTTWPSSVDQPITHALPHLWANTNSVANTYALVDEAGDALILDYGFPSWDHFFADQRFAAHTLDAFRVEADLGRIIATIPSHYHDDHLAGVPWLQREHGAEAWIHESFAEIVAEPDRFDLPWRLDSIRIGVERLIAFEPEVLLTGHTGVLEITRADLDGFVAWARELELAFGRLVPVPGLENEALDPYPAWIDPYRVSIAPGASVQVSVFVRNHAAERRSARLEICAPNGWRVDPVQATILVDGDGATASTTLTITAPISAAAGRMVATVALELDGEARGEVAECLFQVAAQ